VTASVASFICRLAAAGLVALGTSAAMAQGTGTIELSMIPSVGAARVDGPVHWEILTYARDEQGRRWAVADGVGAVRTFTLPEGTYAVRGTYSGIVANHIVEVKADVAYNYVLNLYASWVRLVAVGKESGRAFQDSVQWEVYRASDLEEGKPQVASTSEPQPRLLLREGSYVVKARQSLFAGEAAITLEPGPGRDVEVQMIGPNA
jgi:hypothetical protein